MSAGTFMRGNIAGREDARLLLQALLHFGGDAERAPEFVEEACGEQFNDVQASETAWDELIARTDADTCRKFYQYAQFDSKLGLPLAAPSKQPHLTDVGNETRLVERVDGKLIYCIGPGWHAWDDRRWEHDPGRVQVTSQTKTMIRSMYTEAGKLGNPDERASLAKHALRSERVGAIDAAISLAQRNPMLVRKVEQLDANVDELNCANGILDLTTFELRAHDPAALHTKLVPVDFNANAAAPRWIRFLEEVLPDPDVRDYVQRAIGAALTGDVSDHVLHFPFGDGRNGKSTFLDAVRFVLGDYAQEAAPDLLIAKRGDRGVPNDVAALRGRRFVSTVEVEQGKQFAESLVKQLTGEQEITARFMRQEYFTFKNTAHIWLAANHKPRIRGQDAAIWSRIRLIPFTQSFEGKEDRKLLDTLHAESEGILAWAVVGCRKWRKDGHLRAPEVVLNETEKYKAEQDDISEWADARCIFDAPAVETTERLRQSYTAYCAQVGQRQQRAWPDIREYLERRGCTDGPRIGEKRTRSWRGVKLTADEPLHF